MQFVPVPIDEWANSTGTIRTDRGPVLGARVFVNYGAYLYAFVGAAGLAFAALVILSGIRTPQATLSTATIQAHA